MASLKHHLFKQRMALRIDRFKRKGAGFYLKCATLLALGVTWWCLIVELNTWVSWITACALGVCCGALLACLDTCREQELF